MVVGIDVVGTHEAALSGQLPPQV
eukprot:SAG25_NODE_3455_length_1078_cov_1.214505_1_plen_23_part_10